MPVYHNHHIVPRHLGGSNESTNLLRVTIEEHAEIHKKLWETEGRWQDYIAWKALSGQISGAEAYKLATRMRNLGSHRSEIDKQHISEALKGIKRSETTRQRMSIAKYNQTPETKRKNSLAQKGKPKSQQHCAALCKAQANKVWWKNDFETTRARECPGDNWSRGRGKLKRDKCSKRQTYQK